jgi:hypothetical protein
VLCSKCNTVLPPDSRYCLKCGEPVPVTAIEKVDRVQLAVPDVDREALSLVYPRPRRQRRIASWLLLAALVSLFAWATFSDHPYAQQFQEAVGWSHAIAVTDGSFTVGPNNFTSYKFIVPAGAVNVAITGQFNVVGSLPGGDNSVEAYVLTDTAFAIWQKGYATSNRYESGRVAEATMNAELPAGAGVYYFVINNKFSPRTAKTLNANVLLHYKSWLPEWARLLKDRFWNWVGL